MGKLYNFPSYNVRLSEAILIVEKHLDDDSIALQTKLIAIGKVAEMETFNSIKKDVLVNALRWLFAHYDFEGME